MAPLHSSSSRSSLTCFGVGCPARITSTERPWADPPQPAISSPVQQSCTHQEQKIQRSSGGDQKARAWLVDGSGAARYLNHLCFVNAAALLRLSKSAVLCALGVKLGPAVANDEQG